MARWLEILASYNFEIKHRPGKQHGNADGLSRRPCTDCKVCSRKELKEKYDSDDDNSCRLKAMRPLESSFVFSEKVNCENATEGISGSIVDLQKRSYMHKRMIILLRSH